MKKIILTALAAAALLTGCNRDEIVEMNPQNAISFDNDFVENTTRAIVTKDNLTDFYVHGIRNDGKNIMSVFDNVKVSKNAQSGKFEYQDKRYWFDGDYEFVAFNQDNTGIKEDQDYTMSFTPGADGHLTNATLQWKNIGFEWGPNAEFDLVCATATRTVSENATVGTETVNLTFQHLLTAVSYKITNSLGKAYSLKVTDLGFWDSKMGTYTFGTGWNVSALNTNLLDSIIYLSDFSVSGDAGNEGEHKNVYQSEARYLFPTSKDLNPFIRPRLKIEIIEGGQVAKVLDYRQTYREENVFDLTQPLEAGQKYLVTIDITPETLQTKAIEFDVQKVEAFTDGGNADLALK